MFGMGERNACRGGQGGGWGSLGRCWGTAVLSTARAPVEQAGLCPWGQCFITQMLSEGTGMLLLFSPESLNLNHFLALLQKGLFQVTVETPPSLSSTSHFTVFWKSTCWSLWWQWSSMSAGSGLLGHGGFYECEERWLRATFMRFLHSTSGAGLSRVGFMCPFIPKPIL